MVRINEQQWIGKKLFAQIMRVSEKSVENWLSRCNPDFVAANTKKGGYHNSEIFFTEELAKKLQWIAMRNQANQGPAGTGKSTSEIDFGGQKNNDSIVEHMVHNQDTAVLTTTSPVKAETEKAIQHTLVLDAILSSGNVEAMKEYCQLAMAAVEEKNKALRLEAENRLLEDTVVNQAKRITIDEAQLDFIQFRHPYVAGQLRSDI